MKIYLEVDIKPFRGKNKPYAGFYTPKGRRNQRARIEIDSEQSMFEQIYAHAHEHGHFLCDIYQGEAHKKAPGETRREHRFCYIYGMVAKELFRRYMNGRDFDKFIALLPKEDREEMEERLKEL